MSIAILKKKAMNGNSRLAPISGYGPNGFALNGTRRVIGMVGPTNLGSNGNKHHSCCNEGYDTVHTSVKNTRGMLTSRNICPGKDKCLKPIVQQEVFTQDQYISIKHSTYTGCDLSNSQPHCDCKNQFGRYPYIGSRNVFIGNYTKHPDGFNSHQFQHGSHAISQSEYIKGKYLSNNCIHPTNSSANRAKNRFAHFPPRVNNKGCATLYTNKDAAIKA